MKCEQHSTKSFSTKCTFNSITLSQNFWQTQKIPSQAYTSPVPMKDPIHPQSLNSSSNCSWQHLLLNSLFNFACLQLGEAFHAWFYLLSKLSWCQDEIIDRRVMLPARLRLLTLSALRLSRCAKGAVFSCIFMHKYGFTWI